jgi:hypothetical protein
MFSSFSMLVFVVGVMNILPVHFEVKANVAHSQRTVLNQLQLMCCVTSAISPEKNIALCARV